MKSVFGTNIIYSIFGESHNNYLGVTIHGLPSGIKIDKMRIDKLLERRRPSGNLNTKRVEEDNYEFISGVNGLVTNGDPVTVLVTNKQYDSNTYPEGVCRPGQSDYANYIKQNGLNDYRGGGHLSGRLTVLYVIIYGIIYDLIDKEGIKIASSIKYQGTNTLDTSGGIIEVKATGVKAGLGEPLFNSVESVLSSLFFTIPSVKCVEFGLGKDFFQKTGKEVIDEMQYKDGKVSFLNNYNGGINGGITNGNDIVCSLTFKPISSVPYEVNTINVKTKENIKYLNKGNHDLSIINRALVICEAMMAIGLLELITLSKASQL